GEPHWPTWAGTTRPAQTCAILATLGLFTGTNRGLDQREATGPEAPGEIQPGANGSGWCPGRQPARVCYVNCYVVCGLKSFSIPFAAGLPHQGRGKTAAFEPVSSRVNLSRDFKTSGGRQRPPVVRI